MNNDEHHMVYMQMALDEARQAADIQEVPIGAVLVSAEGVILAKTHNRTICDNDPSAHAEMLAIRQAAVFLKKLPVVKHHPLCYG